MTKHVVVVESPAKAKTIKKYLGKDFNVFASYGHVRDLLPKEGAVEPNNDFAMHYQAIERSTKHVDTIAKAIKSADVLDLATDPDREGEAISWHIYELLKSRNLLEGKEVRRVVFYEITKAAVNEAVANPRDISMDLVNAQQARRALDYLVGFNLSPLLWKKIRRGLSAGRVQSPALRMIVEREQEIAKFESKEYWSIWSDVESDSQPFVGKLAEYLGEKQQQFSVTNEQQATEVRKTLTKAADGKLVVSKIEKKQRKRNPTAPFITSTLQQEAARKLGFTTQRTMRTAQQLYEGIETEEGAVGLITYMRTDSVNLAKEAIDEIRDFIPAKYGKDYLPEEMRIFRTKSKNAQEAHEAIRPTSIGREPNSLKKVLTADQFKLYQLIWRRTLASQMIHALIDTVAVDLSCGEGNRFRANGSTIAHPGFLTVYQEGQDDVKNQDDSADKLLPPLKKGQVITLKQIRCEQHFTEPPPRYTEASLVKALEEHGIGRPSTYASIISTLQNREYVQLDNKRFKPTDVGDVVNRFLTSYFTQYVDYGFTANLEDELDAISRGEQEWIPLLTKFWSPFKERVDDTQENVKRSDVTQELIGEECPQCQKPLALRLGKRGRFVGCTGYPDCDYTRSADGDTDQAQVEEVKGRECPQCQSKLIIREGRYGKFIGCSSYPDCRFIEPLEKPADSGVVCPKCNKANILKRKSRRGKIFYSCAAYPDCDYAIWNEPLAEPCPQCNWPILTLKITKRKGKEKICPQNECKFTETIEEEESN